MQNAPSIRQEYIIISSLFIIGRSMANACWLPFASLSSFAGFYKLISMPAKAGTQWKVEAETQPY